MSPAKGRGGVFRRKTIHPPTVNNSQAGAGNGGQDVPGQEKAHNGSSPSPALPMYNEHGHRINHNGHRVTKGIQPDGESGRRFVHPLKFFIICWRSSCTWSQWTNIFWPFTLAALVLYFNYPQHGVWIFATAYIGMIPAANLVGFAGQELARKIPKVAGVLLETTFGSVVEIILFMVLLIQGRERNFPVIRAAILGSILANLLLCLGLCFFVGGLFHEQQTFSDAVSEVGSNLMLVAGMALVIPTIYYNTLSAGSSSSSAGSTSVNFLTQAELDAESVKISRAAAIILLVAFVFYLFFQARSHHGLYEDILEADEERDHDRHRDLAKEKLTLTECILALLIALMFVSFMAVFLVTEIEVLVERGVHDAFLGLILVPLVEKAAEHITAVDEAYDNQMNFALIHVLGASIQTALLNTPLIILVAWGQGLNLGLNFELFDAVVLILAIIVVGNFLRDEKSDYLEGALCVFVYILIAVTAFYYPNPQSASGTASEGDTGGEAAGAASEAVARLMMGKF